MDEPGVLWLLLSAVAGALVLVLVVLEVRFRRSEAGRRWRGIHELEDRLGKRVAQARSELKAADEELRAGRTETPAHRLIVAALHATDCQELVRPAERALSERWVHVRARRPGGGRVRRRHWFGGKEGRASLQEDLAALETELEAIRAQEADALTEARRQAKASKSPEPEEAFRRYADMQRAVAELIDEATPLEVRKEIRPMGPDALRAAEGFDSEEDFCDRVLVPLLEEFGFRFQREHHLTVRVGSRERTLYVDFLLYDTDGEEAALLEAKRNIRSDGELEEAREQVFSYALFTELSPAMVAAPEGLWIYRKAGSDFQLHERLDLEQAFEEAPRLRRELHRMAGVSEGKATR